MILLRFHAAALIAVIACGCASSPEAKRERLAEQVFITRFDVDEQPDSLRLVVKDLIDVRGSVTTAGSEYFSRRDVPATRDAPLLNRARASEDVVIVGKANLSEFAIGPSGVNSFFGTPPSPIAERNALPRVPGGSSSGSAVAVASDFADVAFGTDTAGSVRVPAAWSGVYGLKTTYGLVSLEGVYPLSPDHLDTVGPLAREIPDLVRGMDLLEAGFAAKYRRAKATQPTGSAVRIGRLPVKGANPEIDEAIDNALRAAGFDVVLLDDEFLEAWEQAEKHGSTIAIADGSRTNWDIRREKGVSSRARETILAGSLESQKSYNEAVTAQSEWERTLARQLDRVDLIALPTVKSNPLPIPTFFRRNAIIDSLVFAQQNTVAVNYAGNPAIAIPVPLDENLVRLTSLQLIGPRNGEAQLINAARLVEKGLKSDKGEISPAQL